MLNAIGESLSDLACSDDEEDGEHEEDDEEDSELGKLSEDDEPSWVMGTIFKTVQQCMESSWQTQMTLDELMQLGWGDPAEYFPESEMKYGTPEFEVPAVVKPQTDKVAATPALTTWRDFTHTVDGIPGQAQMLIGTVGPRSSHMTLGSEKPLSHKPVVTLTPDAVPDSSLITKSKPVEPRNCYPCI